ncbi:MAG: Ig-like domain-containing protein [Pseudomonadota bacterium]|nr:MAG: Ig-like domain-containing protein [Pseudomonadota bacterium]
MLSVDPGQNSDSAVVTTTVQGVFSQAMDPATITTATFSLVGPGGSAIAGTVGYDATTNTAIFTPATDLQIAASYTATLAAGIANIDGRGLGQDFVWNFRTAPTIVRVSETEDGVGADLGNFAPAVGISGRLVGFHSLATNLVSNDTNGVADIFVKDSQNGGVERANTASDGAQSLAGDSLFAAASNTVTGDVVFESDASNLVANDVNGLRDIFVKDTVGGTIGRASVDAMGGEANGASNNAAISRDGTVVVFDSAASNLVANDNNGLRDIFWRDLTTNEIRLVSVDAVGAQANGISLKPAVSDDGRFVVFESDANNLVGVDVNGLRDIFIKDMDNGAILLVSVSAANAQGNLASVDASISANGQLVAFTSAASNLVAGDVNGVTDIFVKNTVGGAISRANTTSAGLEAAGGGSSSAEISADGRYVAFVSSANNLVVKANLAIADIYVKDTQTDAIERLSISALGVESNGQSDRPAMTTDGRYVVFESGATNLIPNDDTSGVDIFRAFNAVFAP